MIIKEQDFRNDTIAEIAKQIAVAARTAPKARGTDNLEIAVLTDDDIARLADRMQAIAEATGQAFFARDAENIRNSEAVLLFGSRLAPLGLNCGYCGFDTCGEKGSDVPCFFNANDMGIAIGSAVSKAADYRIDNRVMFSAGRTAKEMNLLPNCPIILALPLTAKGKSPFYDRK
ncbi:MAG: ferredoxin [Bacteroidales bacterium]|jgi:uncharacterized ferredoxin-like protein|nr:ferredoxin [Bacteroidales bacterium]